MGIKILLFCFKFLVRSRILRYVMPGTHAVLVNLSLTYGIFSQISPGTPSQPDVSKLSKKEKIPVFHPYKSRQNSI